MKTSDMKVLMKLKKHVSILYSCIINNNHLNIFFIEKTYLNLFKLNKNYIYFLKQIFL